MDLLDYLINKRDKKILIIGCGLNKIRLNEGKIDQKDHNKAIETIYSMLKYDGLTLSDKIKDDETLKHYNIDPNRYLEIDLLNFNIEKYDYIDLRFVLHLINPKENNRVGIINKLVNKLNKNGEIGIQCYLYKKENQHFPLTDDEIDKIRKKFCIVEFEFEDNHSDECRTIIIKKPCLLVYLFKQVVNIDCSFFFKKFNQSFRWDRIRHSPI